MRTVTGVFETADVALRVGEKAREVAGPRAKIRVFVAGGSGTVIESSIVSDSSNWLPVTLMGIGLGVIGAMIVGALGGGAGLGLVGLFAGALTGVMLGVWLTGEQVPRHIRAERARTLYKQQLDHGRAVVTVVVPTHAAADRVVALFEAQDGQVTDRFLKQPVHPLPST
ncbi:MAG TPA: hypothetical protein VFF06_00220 [Polyangia bacterium]|nr:hypothetical protein [Polyangia bacterium]